jgi:hypothetical protein
VFADVIATTQARYVRAIVPSPQRGRTPTVDRAEVASRRIKHAVGPDHRDAMIDGLILLRGRGGTTVSLTPIRR